MVTDLEIGVGGHTSTFDGYSDLSDASLILLRQHQGVGEVEGAREFQRTKKRERGGESSSSSCPFRVSLARERERERKEQIRSSKGKKIPFGLLQEIGLICFFGHILTG